MHDAVVRMIIGHFLVFVSWIYNQVSEQVNGIIDRGFDAGLSIGLLIVGLVVLGWYHYKYQQHSRDVISKLVNEKDKNSDDYHKLALQQIGLSQEQIQTNKELRQAVENLERTISRNT